MRKPSCFDSSLFALCDFEVESNGGNMQSQRLDVKAIVAGCAE